MPKYSLYIHRFPYGGSEASECVDWLMKTYHQAKLDPRFDRVVTDRLNDTPITMTRNAAIMKARAQGFDYLLIVDSDMAPDVDLAGDPTAKPFFDVAVDFALANRARPVVIAAPYCGPPPHENIYVFRWANRGNTLHPSAANARLDQFTREEAAVLAGVQEVGALPTGLMLLDLRAFDHLPHPWTYYEYHDAGADCDQCGRRGSGPETQKASTEDVTLTRDLGLLGVGIYCAWDSWAGHIKRYVVGKPRPYTTDVVAVKMREALGRRVYAGEQMIEVAADPNLRPAPPLSVAEYAVPPGGWRPAVSVDQLATDARSVIHPRTLDEIDRELFLPNRHIGPTDGAVDGAAPPPAGVQFPWQIVTPADLLSAPLG